MWRVTDDVSFNERKIVMRRKDWCETKTVEAKNKATNEISKESCLGGPLKTQGFLTKTIYQGRYIYLK